jgi:hypothetical protein
MKRITPRPASGARYAISSQFTKAFRDIAERIEHSLFLSATPHNGHSNSFSALLEIHGGRLRQLTYLPPRQPVARRAARRHPDYC